MIKFRQVAQGFKSSTRERQLDLHEFKAILIYTVSSQVAKAME